MTVALVLALGHHPQAKHPSLPEVTGSLLKRPPQRSIRQRDGAHRGPASGEPGACVAAVDQSCSLTPPASDSAPRA